MLALLAYKEIWSDFHSSCSTQPLYPELKPDLIGGRTFHNFHSVTVCSLLVSSRSSLHSTRSQPLVSPHLAPMDS